MRPQTGFPTTDVDISSVISQSPLGKCGSSLPQTDAHGCRTGVAYLVSGTLSPTRLPVIDNYIILRTEALTKEHSLTPYGLKTRHWCRFPPVPWQCYVILFQVMHKTGIAPPHDQMGEWWNTALI